MKSLTKVLIFIFFGVLVGLYINRNVENSHLIKQSKNKIEKLKVDAIKLKQSIKKNYEAYKKAKEKRIVAEKSLHDELLKKNKIKWKTKYKTIVAEKKIYVPVKDCENEIKSIKKNILDKFSLVVSLSHVNDKNIDNIAEYFKSLLRNKNEQISEYRTQAYYWQKKYFSFKKRLHVTIGFGGGITLNGNFATVLNLSISKIIK